MVCGYIGWGGSTDSDGVVVPAGVDTTWPDHSTQAGIWIFSVGRAARIGGQPSSCGDVGVPNLAVNHSRTTGCAQANEPTLSASGVLKSWKGIPLF